MILFLNDYNREINEDEFRIVFKAESQLTHSVSSCRNIVTIEKKHLKPPLDVHKPIIPPFLNSKYTCNCDRNHIPC